MQLERDTYSMRVISRATSATPTQYYLHPTVGNLHIVYCRQYLSTTSSHLILANSYYQQTTAVQTKRCRLKEKSEDNSVLTMPT